MVNPATKLFEAELTCSCCQKNNRQHRSLTILGDSESDFAICHECLLFFWVSSRNISDNIHEQKKTNEPQELPMPKDIYQALNRDVIKQEDAKKAISIAVAHHYRRLLNPTIGKSNVLLIGKTGTGKTEIVRSVANYLNVPFASADASHFTARGYSGEDTESVIKKLLLAAKSDVAEAERGIVFIDEIDKIAKKESNDSGVGSTLVQQQLLKIIEGDKIFVKIPSPDGREQLIEVNTANILFICAGAFVGLDKIVKNESQSGTRPMGLGAKNIEEKNKEQADSILKNVQPTHLEKFGMIPELLGRLPVITSTDALSVVDLIRILKEPQNSIVKQYQALFALDGVELNFHEDFLKQIADEAFKKDIGARGLRSVMELKMQTIFYEIDQYQNQRIEVTINGKVVCHGSLFQILKRNAN
jgi:ATP-dependent Clp protease ATP-binding subunit ClpX